MTAALRHAAIPPRRSRWSDPDITADGQPRAWAPLQTVEGPGALTLWFDVGVATGAPVEADGTSRASLSRADVASFLDEIDALRWPTRRIAFMGREIFRRRGLLALVEEALQRGFEALIVTSAEAAMLRADVKTGLLDLHARFGPRLGLETTLADHAGRRHDLEHGAGAFCATLAALAWVTDQGLRVRVLGGRRDDETEGRARGTYRRLFERKGVRLNAHDPGALRLAAPRIPVIDPPEISTSSWAALGLSPADLPCSSARAVVKRAADAPAVVLACPFILDDPAFELGETLAAAERPVTLRNPRCAQLCARPRRPETPKPAPAPLPREPAETCGS